MEVVLHTTNCPKCAVLKVKLDAARIEYTTNTDVDTMISKGFMSAPVLEVDGRAMDFVDAIKWTNERIN